MSDRLAQLVRQRALLEEHLAWLNREIAMEKEHPTAATDLADTVFEATPLPPEVESDRPVIRVQPPAPPAVALPTPEVEADEIMAKYRIPSSALKDDVRKGCLLYFVAAFAVLGLGVALLYLLISHRR